MFLLNKNSNSEDIDFLALDESPFFSVDGSGDKVHNSPPFYSRFLSSSKIPATLMRILCDDG